MTGQALAQAYMPFEFHGQKVMGRPVGFKDTHIQIALQGGGLTNVPWGQLSQASLESLTRIKNYDAYARPFIDPPAQRPPQGPRITIKEVARLERPASGGLFASPVMLLVFFLLYLANIYAAYEVAMYRQRNTAVVCGLAAVAPVIVPIIYMAMPGAMEQHMTEEVEGEETATEEGATEAPATEEEAVPAEEAAAPANAEQQSTVYQRGQFTFNRRFFETKLAGFLKVVPGEAEKDMVLVITSSRGTYVGPRLTRVSPNDLTLHVVKAGVSQDVMLPFNEINQVTIRHKDGA
jgi:hypothetical protein